MPDTDTDAKFDSFDDELLHEVRTRFDYAQTYWQEIQKEGSKDMAVAAGDAWPPAERKRRTDAGRVIVSLDECSQYINQVVNDVRQNKRGVQVNPKGYGANDKTAEIRGNLIREIEYNSNAESAYITAFENAIQRSYGGWRIKRRYVSSSSFMQEIYIEPIPNPDCSYPDPDAMRRDFSDAMYWFLVQGISHDEFKRRWPKAKITDFSGEQAGLAPNWIKEKQVMVGEYWKVELTERVLCKVLTKKGTFAMFEDELPTKGKFKVLAKRDVEERQVKQYMTNGIEILEVNDEPGEYIPIVWFCGKEYYLNTDTGDPRRVWESMIRKARDPQMLVNYYSTCEAEVVGQTPRTPFIGYVGQFHNPSTWQNINSDPRAYLEAKATIEGLPNTLLPLPTRQPYVPAIEPLEIGREAARRAVQSAMGLTGLPTQAQMVNEKSGVALEQIDENEDRGSFHFIDNYEMAIEHSGRIINSWIAEVYNDPREIGQRDRTGKHSSVKINQQYADENGQPQFHSMTAGDHEVTIAAGPSFKSERDAANKFSDVVIPELEALIPDPGIRMQLMALFVKLKNVGPVGDEIVKLLTPNQGAQQQAAALAQAQQQAADYQKQLADLMTENQILHAEKNGKVVDNQFMIQKAQLDNQVKLEIAQITAKAQDAQQRDELWGSLMQELQAHVHEAIQKGIDHAHDVRMASIGAANAATAADQQQQNGNSPANAGA